MVAITVAAAVRWARRAASALLVVIGLAVVAAQTAAVHDAVRTWVQSWVSARSGVAVVIGTLHYDLRTMTMVAENVSAASRVAPAASDAATGFDAASAARIIVLLSWWDVLQARFEPRRVSLSGVEVRGRIRDRTVALGPIDVELWPDAPRRWSGRVRGSATTLLRLATASRRVTRLALAIGLDGDRLEITSLQMSLPGSELEGRARAVNLFASSARLDAAGTVTGRLRDWCDVLQQDAAACDVLDAATLTSRFVVDGPPARPAVRLDASVAGLTIADGAPVPVEAAIAVRDGSIAVTRIATAVFGGRVLVHDAQFDVESGVAAGTLSWRQVSARQVFKVAGTAAAADASLSGEVRFSGDLRVPASLAADGRVAVEPVTGSVDLTGAATVHLADERWSSRVDARLTTVGIVGDVSGAFGGYSVESWRHAPLSGTLTVTTADLPGALRSGRELGLPLGGDDAGWRGSAHAEVTLGGTLGAPLLRARVDADARPTADAPSIAARAVIGVASGTVTLEELAAVSGPDVLTATGVWDRDRDAIAGSFSASVPDLSSLDGLAGHRWPLGGAATLTGRLSGTLSRPQLDAAIRGTDLTVAIDRPGQGEDGVERRTFTVGAVDVTVAAADRVDVHLDAPDLRMTMFSVVGLSAGWPFVAVAEIENGDVGALAAALGAGPSVAGHAEATLVASGRGLAPGTLQATVELRQVALEVGDIPVTLTRPAHARIADGRVISADLDARVGDLQIAVERERAMAPWTVTVTGIAPVLVPGLPDPPHLRVDATIDETRLAIRRASLWSRDTAAELSGHVPLWFVNAWQPNTWPGSRADEPAAMALTVQGVPLDTLIAASRPEMKDVVDGRLDVRLEVSANAPSPAAILAHGSITGGWVSVSGLTFTQDGAATLSMADGRAGVHDLRWIAPGSIITANAESAVAGETSFDLTAAATLDAGALLAGTGERVAGTLQIDLAARGDAQALTWSADAEVRDGAWLDRARRIAVDDAEGRIACADGRCTVRALSARVNGGQLSAEGNLPVAGHLAGADLRLTLRGASAELPRGTRHDIDADLQVGGSDAVRVTGAVTLWPGVITGSILGIASDLSSLPSGRSPDAADAPDRSAWADVPLDIRIATGSDLAFDSHDLQLAATADLRLRGTVGAPQLRGSVAALEHGRIFLGGRMWDLDEGHVTLGSGADGTETRVAATVSARIAKYAVQMAVSGPVGAPTLTMSSDPPLGQSDLADLVLTGTITGNSARAGGQQVATMVSGELLSGAGRTVGIDAVRIEQHQSELSTTDIEPVSRLTISKRLSSRSEVVYSQGLSDSDDQAWVLIYRPGWQSLDVRATIRTNGAEAYEFRQELELGSTTQRAATRQRRVEPEVARVDIEGVPDDIAAALRSRLTLSPGQGFSIARWQRDRQQITKFFHDRDRLAVRVRASHTLTDEGGYALLYRITPGPVARIEVKGYALNRQAMANLRDAWSRTVIEALLEDELTLAVRLELARHRFYTAEVTTRFRPIEDGGRLAVIEISPGTRVRTSRIEFSGTGEVPEAELEQVVSRQRLAPLCWIEPGVLDAPIVSLYRSRGYLDARVRTERAIQRSSATLTVAIDPGRLFAVGTVTFTGTTVLGERARSSFGLDTGAPFTGDALTSALTRLRTGYARAGYLEAEVGSTATVHRERARVDLAIAVTEGRLSVLREVAIAGREETSERLVTRAFDVAPAGPADPVALDEGQQRLYRTGIFRTVDVAIDPVEPPAPPAAPRQVQATVRLEERAAYRVRYGVQFGPSTIDSITSATDTAEPGATFDLQRRNILGEGIVAGVGGVWSAHQHRVRGTVSAATLRGRFVSSAFTIEQANQDRDWNDGVLQVVDRSLRAIFEQRWRTGTTRRVEFAYGFEIDRRQLRLQASSDVLPLRAQLADVNLTLTYDSRDNRFNPRRGTFHTSRVEVSAGAWLSNLAFTRYQVQHYGYWPVRGATFASGVRFGALDVDQQRNPTSLLLFFKAGGATSVRGYETDSLTPAYVIGVPAGGKALLVLNEELRIPVTRRLGVVSFLDAGNTFTGLNALSFAELKVGAGVGLRVDTPVAVLRLDLALPLPQQPGGPRHRWYLSIGQAF